MRSSLVVGCFLACATLTALDAQALSFGRVRSAPTLGQPLSVAVPLLLDENETLTPECIRAEVLHGEAMWPASVMRARITQGSSDSQRVVRISSTTVVEEPSIVLTVHGGCPTKFSRTYTLLADPPIALATTASASIATPGSDREARPAASSPSSSGWATASDGVVAPGTALRARPARAAQATTAPASRANATPRQRRQSVTGREGSKPSGTAITPSPSAGLSIPAASSASQALPAASPSSTPAATGAREDAGADRPRLKLDVGAVTMSRAMLEDAQAKASSAEASAKAAQASASAAEGRMLAMEQELVALRAEARRWASAPSASAAAPSSAGASLAVQPIAAASAAMASPAAVEASSAAGSADPGWWPWLLGVAALSLSLAAWFGLKLRQAREAHKRDAWWNRQSRLSVAPSQFDAADSEMYGATKSSASEGPASKSAVVSPSQQPPAAPAPALAPLTPSVNTAANEALRAVSVDEQIDLEQEADFFIALGHDDAAIDLLLAHLKNTGGAAPMPYLKLLEIYRRRGDRDDYELMRRRFNHRFNSVAPDWDEDGKLGRHLENYPDHLKRLQMAWPMPLDAMAELEAMAFGRSDGHELFDLPAYQDVLFLYQMARTLHDAHRVDTASEDVDVLLPIGSDAPGADIELPTLTALASASSAASVDSLLGGLDLDISTSHPPLVGGAMSGPQMVKPYRGNPLGEMPKIDLTLPPPKAADPKA